MKNDIVGLIEHEAMGDVGDPPNHG